MPPADTTGSVPYPGQRRGPRSKSRRHTGTKNNLPSPYHLCACISEAVVPRTEAEGSDRRGDRGRWLPCHLDNIAMVTLRPHLSLVMAVSSCLSPRYEQRA